MVIKIFLTYEIFEIPDIFKIDQQIKEADENNDGKIDFAEFMRLLKAFLEEQDDD